LTSVTIGNSVTSIRKQAFLGCSGLKSVTIGNGVESVGREAFYNCTGLTSVHISDIDSWAKIKFEYNATSNPLYYAEHLYMNGEEVKDIVISDGVDSIGRFAFCHCSGLTSLSIPDGVTSIGGSAFSGCKSLTSVTIGNSVTSIDAYAFSGCSGLTSVTIGNSVTSIGKYAFYNCSGLTLATIGNGVDSIGDYAFSSCTALSSIQVPEKVEKLGNSVFEGCSALASASLPKGMKNIPMEVKMCTFALINTLNTYSMDSTSSRNKNIASESTDGYSVSYASGSQVQEIVKSKSAELNEIIRTYLLGVVINGQHILYVGV
jgi:hypothetical protein